MLFLDINGYAIKEIERIKAEAEQNPISPEELQSKAENLDFSFPEHLTTIVPEGWRVGYVVEQQPEPHGVWRRLRVDLNREDMPPTQGIIELMTAFGFECPAEQCIWAQDVTTNVGAVCVMEPLGGIKMMEEFLRRMAMQEIFSEVLDEPQV